VFGESDVKDEIPWHALGKEMGVTLKHHNDSTCNAISVTMTGRIQIVF